MKKWNSLLDALNDLRELDQHHPGLTPVVLKKVTEGSEECAPPHTQQSLPVAQLLLSSNSLWYTLVMG